MTVVMPRQRPCTRLRSRSGLANFHAASPSARRAPAASYLQARRPRHPTTATPQCAASSTTPSERVGISSTSAPFALTERAYTAARLRSAGDRDPPTVRPASSAKPTPMSSRRPTPGTATIGCRKPACRAGMCFLSCIRLSWTR
jgi:hypothetical protein